MEKEELIANPHPKPLNRFSTVKLFSEKYPEWTEGRLRYLIYENPNGFDRVLRRVGQSILIDEVDFFDWIDAQRA